MTGTSVESQRCCSVTKMIFLSASSFCLAKLIVFCVCVCLGWQSNREPTNTVCLSIFQVISLNGIVFAKNSQNMPCGSFVHKRLSNWKCKSGRLNSFGSNQQKITKTVHFSPNETKRTEDKIRLWLRLTEITGWRPEPYLLKQWWKPTIPEQSIYY